MSKHTYLYLFVSALFLFLVSPFLLSEGMFMDGLFYATIARNLAEGMGSLWYPYFTATDFAQFHEHPPLAFWLQSIFFSLFGDTVYVEKLYSLGTFVLTAWIMVKIWKEISDGQFTQLGWLPLLFWVLCPLVFWAAPNNMLENTLMIFTTFSVYVLIKSLDEYRVAYILVAGLLLFLACLTKGFVALFPWSFFFWVFVFRKEYRFGKMLADTAFLIGSTVVLFLLLFLFVPESYKSLSIYFENQVVGSIQNVQTVNTRFYIIWAVLLEFIPAGTLMLIAWLSTFRKNMEHRSNKWGLIFLVLGLSAVLPMMISMKQRGFYIIPSLPIFAIAFAYFIRPSVASLTNRIEKRSVGFHIFKYSSILLFFISVVVNINEVNTIGRNGDKIQDVFQIGELVPDSSILSISGDLENDYALIGYFYRYHHISLEHDPSWERAYALVGKHQEEKVPQEYEKVEVELRNYELYRKIDD